MAKNNENIVKKQFKIDGMQCGSCEKIINRKTMKLKGVREIVTDWKACEGYVVYDSSKTSMEKIFAAIDDAGYDCSISQKGKSGGQRITLKKSQIKHGAITFGLLLAAIGAYTILSQYFEAAMPQIGQDTSLALLFIIGFFTGFHCIAMCGGFVISYSNKDAKNGRALDLSSHATYGLSKTVSYAVIGALFGFVGSFFTFTPLIRGVAAVIAGLFLVLFGLNMLNMLTSFRKYRIQTPGFLNKLILKESKTHNPMIIGLMNGLMIACGPLQAIYLLAAASGSAYWGALYLAAFGLGTLPVLLGFGLITSIISARMTNQIVRYSGVLVVLLGLIMVNRGLSLTGTGYDSNTILTSITPQTVSAQTAAEVTPIKIDDSGYQTIKMKVTRYGWEPDKFILKKGVPVKWEIDGVEITSCNNAIQVPKYGLNFPIKPGKQTIEFTPDTEGVVPWSCWMGMIPGTFVVKDDIDIENQAAVAQELAKVEVPQGGSCGGSGGGCGCGG